MGQMINTDELKEGSILGEPVLNNFGQVLVPHGAVITERHKNLFKTWNIRVVNIISENFENTEEISDELYSKGEEIVSKRVLWKPELPYEHELWKVGVLCAVERLK